MEIYDWYDRENPQNKIQALSKGAAEAASVSQYLIQAWIKYYNPGKKYRVVSGWRSVAANNRCGGVADSLHLPGLARDFRGVGHNDPPSVPPFLQCLPSGPDGLTWHVQLRFCRSFRRDVIRRFVA